MTCYGWKGGIGTSSRKVQLDVPLRRNTFTVGVLVQANQGTRNWHGDLEEFHSE